MACEFLTLYSNDKGYVVRCKDCGYYQIGFISTMLTLSAFDFQIFIQLIEHKLEENQTNYGLREKNTLIETPFPGFYMILSKMETKQFLHMLEKADSEAKALELLKLFDK